ncbi:MAG: PPE family protein [Mycobacterium sp.]
MVDFGALPPEINSARMYTGPGPGPMLAAASAWDVLAGQLETFATGYSATISGLHDHSWSGEASTAMAAAVAPYVAWASRTSAQAGEAANRARAAVSAFETAFIATVHPAAVAANRVQLATLVATNFFGQNTAAIAATEAAYAEMWAQDAAAMYGYAAASSAATAVNSFSQAPQTTNSITQSVQGDAVAQAVNAAAGHTQTALSQLMSLVPQQLQNLASAAATNAPATDSSATATPILTTVGEFNTLSGPLNLAYQVPYTAFSGGTFYNGLTQSKIQSKDLPAITEEDAGKAVAADKAAKIVPEGVGEPVFAAVDRAEPIGTLSVPQSWMAATSAPGSAAAPAPEPGFRVLPPWTADSTSTAPTGMPSVGQISNGPVRRGGNAVFRMRDRRYRIPRPALGG